MGLWKGVGPNIARNAIINAAELASYDQVGAGAMHAECCKQTAFSPFSSMLQANCLAAIGLHSRF